MKICSGCGEYFAFGGILWLPDEAESRGETCLRCAVVGAKLPKGAKILHIKKSE